MVSTFVTQDLDFSREQDSGVIAVDRRMRDMNSRCNPNQLRRAAGLARCLTVSDDNHLGFCQADVVAGSCGVPCSQPAGDAATAGRQLGILVLRVIEPVKALNFGGGPAVSVVGWTGTQNVDDPRLSLAHRIVDVVVTVSPDSHRRQHRHGQRRRGSTSTAVVVLVVPRHIHALDTSTFLHTASHMNDVTSYTARAKENAEKEKLGTWKVCRGRPIAYPGVKNAGSNWTFTAGTFRRTLFIPAFSM